MGFHPDTKVVPAVPCHAACGRVGSFPAPAAKARTGIQKFTPVSQFCGNPPAAVGVRSTGQRAYKAVRGWAGSFDGGYNAETSFEFADVVDCGRLSRSLERSVSASEETLLTMTVVYRSGWEHGGAHRPFTPWLSRRAADGGRGLGFFVADRARLAPRPDVPRETSR